MVYKQHFKTFSKTNAIKNDKPRFITKQLIIKMKKEHNNEVINNIRALAKRTLPSNASVILYGSRARGEATENSDWDLLILLDKSSIEQSDYDKFVYPFTYLGWEMSEMIIPVAYTKQEWNSISYLPFYKNVEQDKIVLQ